MPSLRELQRAFADALVDERSAPRFAAGADDAAQRIAIYRNNVLSNYRNALGASYPVVRRLVGKPFFDTAVDAFVQAHPSVTGDLNDYGGDFAAFLARYRYAQDLPYLPDVARLEWALDEAQRAPERDGTAALVVTGLAALPPERLPQAKLALDPSCRLVASDFPVLQIWRVNQPDHGGDMHVDFDRAPDRLLVRRDQGVVGITRVDGGAFAWLAALAGAMSLGDALDAARAVDDGFDLDAAFRTHIGDGTLARVLTDAVS